MLTEKQTTVFADNLEKILYEENWKKMEELKESENIENIDFVEHLEGIFDYEEIQQNSGFLGKYNINCIFEDFADDFQ